MLAWECESNSRRYSLSTQHWSGRRARFEHKGVCSLDRQRCRCQDATAFHPSLQMRREKARSAGIWPDRQGRTGAVANEKKGATIKLRPLPGSQLNLKE